MAKLNLVSKYTFAVLFLANMCAFTYSIPIQFNDTRNSSEEMFLDEPVDVANVSYIPKDLLIIRTLFYEIGVLTDADPNLKTNETESEDELEIKYLKPPQNNTVYDWWRVINESNINPTNIAFERLIELPLTIFEAPNRESTSVTDANDSIYDNTDFEIFKNSMDTSTQSEQDSQE